MAEFTEVESGKRHKNRPQLLAAIAAAGRHLESGVLVTVDPEAHRITILPIDIG